MWIYTKESLLHRLQLPLALGLALDYWLHIHSEDVHPFWGARPIGFRSTITAILNSNGTHDSVMRRQLKHELRPYLGTHEYLAYIDAPPVGDIAADTCMWDDKWLKWAESALLQTDIGAMMDRLWQLFAESIACADHRRTCYFARRLSAELSDAGWSVRQLFMRMKVALCDSGTFSGSDVDIGGMAAMLRDTFARGATAAHNVTVSFAPVIVPKSFPGQLLDSHGLPVLRTEEVDETTVRIVGATKTVWATDPESALVDAHHGFRQLIDSLRVRHYVRTTFCGAVRVDVKDHDEPIWLALPQPFWRKRANRRAVPQVPPIFNGFVDRVLPEPERAAWHAARWHLSQSFADWPEDPHEAATKCWQALESFSPGSQKAMPRVIGKIAPYLSIATRDAREMLARRLSTQAVAIETATGVNSWYRWNQKKNALGKWLARVSDVRSSNHWSNWQHSPQFLFDADCGLFTMLGRYAYRPELEKWMSLRLEADFALLYGLRNKVVHTGIRQFSSGVATYLGRTAVEVVLALMNERHHCAFGDKAACEEAGDGG